jgi:hypothetical protein
MEKEQPEPLFVLDCDGNRHVTLLSPLSVPVWVRIQRESLSAVPNYEKK